MGCPSIPFLSLQYPFRPVFARAADGFQEKCGSRQSPPGRALPSEQRGLVFFCLLEEIVVKWRKTKEVWEVDMDTLGFFIFMDEMEKGSQEQEDDDEEESD